MAHDTSAVYMVLWDSECGVELTAFVISGDCPTMIREE